MKPKTMTLNAKKEMTLSAKERAEKKAASLKVAKAIADKIAGLKDKHVECLLQAEEYTTGFYRGNMVINRANGKVGQIVAVTSSSIPTLGVRIRRKRDGNIGIPVTHMYDNDKWELYDDGEPSQDEVTKE